MVWRTFCIFESVCEHVRRRAPTVKKKIDCPSHSEFFAIVRMEYKFVAGSFTIS